MGRLYDAFIEVGPRFAGMGDIKKQGAQAGKEYGKALADAAVKAAQANARNLGQALAKARSSEADAAGKVRVAEAKLNEVRAKGKATVSQIAAAEEALASAQRKSASASNTAKDAAEALGKAQKRVSDLADSGGKSAGGRFSSAFKSGLSRLGGDKEGKQFATRFGVGMNGAIGGVVSRSAGIFVAGFAAIKSADLFKDFIAEARESRRVGDLTAAAIKSTGGAAKLSAQQIGDLATAISNKTGADDEAIQSGENLLLTFTNIKNGVGKGNDIFNQATQAVTDMTAALNDGQVTQDGVKASSIQLGKALNDPIKGVTALQKVGVSFTADQKKQIKTLVDSGKTMDAQKIILKELSKEFGGAAAAATDPLTKLDTIVGNVKETIGGAFLPVVDKAATWLGNVLPGAVASAGQFFNSKLLPPLKGIATFVSGSVIPGFQGLYDLLVKHDFSKEFRKAFHVEEDSPIVGFLLSVSEGVKTAAANAKTWAGSIIKGLTSGFGSGDWKPLGAAIGSGVIDGLKALESGGSAILDAVGGLLEKIDWGKLGSSAGNGIRDLLHSVDWKAVGSSLGDAVVTIFQGLGDLSDKVRSAFKTLMDKVDWKQIGKDSTDAIGQFAAGVDWGKVAKTLSLAAIKSLKFDKSVYDSVVGSAADLIIGMADEIGKAIGGAFKDAGTWLLQKGKDLISGLLSGASSQAGGIGAWFSSHVIQPVQDAFGSVAGIVEKAFTSAIGFVKSVWAGIVSAVTGPVNTVLGVLNSIWSRIYPILALPFYIAKDTISKIFTGIQTTFTTVAGWVSGTFSKAWSAVSHVLSVPVGLALGLIRTAWSGITTAFTTGKNFVVSVFAKAWAAVKGVISVPVSGAKTSLDTIWSNIKAAFNAVKGWAIGAFAKAWSGLKTIITTPITLAKNAITTVLGAGKGGLRWVFSQAVSGISAIWNKLQSLAKVPIKFIIDTVLNKGLIGAFNWIAGKFNAPTIKPIPLPKGFADGGRIPGAPSAVDNTFGMHKGKAIPLATGEFIVNAKQTRKHLPLLRAINTGAGGYADGGLFGSLKNAVSGAFSKGKNLVGDVADFTKDAAGWLKKKFSGPLDKMSELGDSAYAKIITKVPRNLADTIVGKAKDLLSGLFAGGGAGPNTPVGKVVNFRGEKLNQRTIAMLLSAEAALRRTFHIMQGSYSTRVAASGSTHAGGGAMDTDNAGAGWDPAVRALRAVGFAAWHRTPSQGPWGHHIHSIALDDPTASPAAKAQMASFRRGGDGLGHANGGRIGSYADGAWKILADQLALVHKDEMVVPAKSADYLRKLLPQRGTGRLRGQVRSRLHQLHEAHLAHTAHTAHVNHLNALGHVSRLPRYIGADTTPNGVTGNVRLHPDDIQAVAYAVADAVTSNPLQVNFDGRKLDQGLSRSALNRGY